MPTERFKRLPEEKIEAIRRAGIQEFTRTSPESASINPANPGIFNPKK